MKTKVSKKAIGIFVASAVVLLLVVFMMSEPTRVAMATRASQCRVRPENASISTGTDLPFPQPIFGGREEPTPPRPPIPSTPNPSNLPNPPNPPIVIGGGGASPWGLNPYLTNLPISTPSPIAGQWSPLATPALGGHPPNPIACQLGHEGESLLSQNETRPMDTQTDDLSVTSEIAEERIYHAHKKHLYELWALLKEDGLLIEETVAALHNNELAIQLGEEFDAESARVQAIFRATGSNHRPNDYHRLVSLLTNFEWLSADARTLNKVNIGIGNGNVLAIERG
jgi:hypothetical protein